MVRSSLTSEAVKTLVHAFISSHLDYCNSLLYGNGDGLLTKLQTVQNAAARVVTGTRKFDHFTPVLRQLYWLLVRQRITFKLAMISAFVVWRHHTWQMCAPRSRLSSAGVSCGRLTAGQSPCRAQGPQSVRGTLPWLAWPHGTASPSTCGLHHCPEIHLRKKTEKSIIWLRALLRSSLIGRYTN